MAWARLDDGFDDHPKVLDLLDGLPEMEGAAAVGLWTLALTYAHRTMREAKIPGFVPRSFPRRCFVPAGLGKRLVSVGLWEEAEGGWLIHDFDKYLPTDELRAKRSEAGKRGAEARWGKRPSGDGNLPSGAMCSPSKSHAEEPPEYDASDPDESDFDCAGGAADTPANGPGSRSAGPDGKLPSVAIWLDGKKCPEPEPEPEEKLSTFSSETASPPSDTTKAAASKPAKKPKPVSAPRPDVEALCARLVELMVANDCKPPTVTDKWRTEARLLLDKDDRGFDKAMRLLEWCQDSEFWKPNIHSIPTFRKKYDQLRQQANAEWVRNRNRAVGASPAEDVTPGAPSTEITPYGGTASNVIPFQRSGSNDAHLAAAMERAQARDAAQAADPTGQTSPWKAITG